MLPIKYQQYLGQLIEELVVQFHADLTSGKKLFFYLVLISLTLVSPVLGGVAGMILIVTFHFADYHVVAKNANLTLAVIVFIVISRLYINTRC